MGDARGGLFSGVIHGFGDYDRGPVSPGVTHPGERSGSIRGGGALEPEAVAKPIGDHTFLTASGGARYDRNARV